MPISFYRKFKISNQSNVIQLPKPKNRKGKVIVDLPAFNELKAQEQKILITTNPDYFRI
jgi:hypothetical protein